MASIAEIRQKYPQYQDLTDRQLADAIYAKSYSDMPKAEFDFRIGMTTPAANQGRMHAPMLAERPSLMGQAAEFVTGPVNQRINEAGTGAYKGLADVAGFSGNLRGGPGETAANLLAGVIPGANLAVKYLPSGADVEDFFFNTLGIPKVEPTDASGDYLQAGSRMAAAMAALPMGMAPAALARVGAVSGVAGEGAVDLTQTQGTPAEQWARLGGNLLGGGVGALAQGAMRPPTAALLASATKGVTPAEWNTAAAIHANAASRITGPEALAQAGGGNQFLTGLQRVVEQSRGGGPVMGRYMAQRSPANAAAAEMEFGRIAAQPAAPERVAGNLIEGAGKVISAERGAVSAATKPHYEAAAMAPVDESKIGPLLTKIDTELAKVGPASEAGKALIAFRDRIAPDGKITGNVGALDQIYKEMRDKLAGLPTDANAMQAAVKGIIGPINRELGTTLTVMNDDLAYGRALHGIMTSEKVDPLIKGVIGKIADAIGFGGVRNVLAPGTRDALAEISPRSLATALTAIKREAPEALEGFVRRYLDSMFAEANQDLVAGSNTFGGAKFRAELVGNQQQSENLRTLLEALPNGQNAWPGFKRFLETLQAQGRRAPPGSATEFNKQISQDLGTGKVEIAIKPKGYWQDAYERFRFGRNTKELAEIFLNENSVALIKKLAFERPNTARAAATVATILSAGRATQ